MMALPGFSGRVGGAELRRLLGIALELVKKAGLGFFLAEGDGWGGFFQ
jgi:hypothetical protein